jgi:hypothetical protein
MTTVRIVDGLKYGFRFLGLYLGLLLVSGAVVVGGLAIAGDPVLSLRGGTLVLTPNLAAASQTVLGGFAVVAIGALLWLAFSFGLLYKLIADAVSTGVGLSTHRAGPAVAGAEDEGDEADDTFAGGSDDGIDADQGTAREPPAAATSTSEDDDVLSKMQASEQSRTGADADEPDGVRADRGDVAAGSTEGNSGRTQATDPLSTDERVGADDTSTGSGERGPGQRSGVVDADIESGTDPTVGSPDSTDQNHDESTPTESGVGRDDERERVDEPAAEGPQSDRQRDFERESAGQSTDSPEDEPGASGGAEEADTVGAEEYDERGYPRRDSAGGDDSAEVEEPADGANPLNEPADPPEPSDEFVERTEDSAADTVPLDEPLTDDEPEDTPPGRSSSTPLDEPVTDEGEDDEAVPLDEPITDADEEDDEAVPLDEPIDDDDIEDTTDEPGDWEPLDESDLKD